MKNNINNGKNATKNSKNNNVNINKVNSVNAEPVSETEKVTNLHETMYILIVIILCAFGLGARFNGGDGNIFFDAAILFGTYYWINRALSAEKKLRELTKTEEDEPVKVEAEEKKPYNPKEGLIITIGLFVLSGTLILDAYLGYIGYFEDDFPGMWFAWFLFIMGVVIFLFSIFFGVTYVGEINPRFRAKLPKWWQKRIEENLNS